MINLQAKKHDNFSVEFKFGFVSDETEKINDFAVNTWLFIPNSMGISSQTYGKDQFYRDIKSNVRLITPVFSLSELAEETSLPFARLKDSIVSLTRGEDKTEDFEYHLKMYAAIFKSALRNSTNSIRGTQNSSKIDAACTQYRDLLSSILHHFRSLYPLVETIADREKQHFAVVDEYMSYIITTQATNIVKSIDSRTGADLSSTRQAMVEFILEEKRYATFKGFDALDNDPVHNRELLYNQSIQKKYIESDLYINLAKRKDGVAVEQLYYSIAAGVAMIFATAIGWATQVKFGNITGPLFVVLVISYMMKDRIKDLMRYWFAHKLVNKYYDKKAGITIGSRKVGMLKEAADFVSGSKIPEEVTELRKEKASMDDESHIFEEKVLLYRKHLVLDNDALMAENQYPLRGINEIMRLHLNRFMQKMDNPEVPVNMIDENGEITTVRVQRVYCMHVICQLKHLDQTEYRHLRIVLNRNGILRVEDL